MATLIVPPIRTALINNPDGSPLNLSPKNPDGSSNGGPLTTEKQWWFYWRDLGNLINQDTDTLSKLVTHGNHGERPAPADMPEGALYVETDRGNALYQNIEGRWLYIAGTMFGTLSPDQRPTDLGAPDVGFDFRTDTSPAREFLWSGGRWIETTPVRFDTHAERLAAPIADLVDGMLWMETDRGNVIYQNQGGTWLYLTGDMWGTLSPDQRPTDLGVNDTGFTFLATVTPLREFIWSSAAWVETTPAQDNLLQLAQASAGLTLTTTAAAIPGATLTLTRIGRYLITGCFQFVGGGTDNNSAALGQLRANGTALPQLAILQPLMIAGTGVTGSPNTGHATVFQQWSYLAATAGQVVTLEAWKNGGTGASSAGTLTTISALWVSP